MARLFHVLEVTVSTRTVLETWEELPVRKDGVEQHEVDPGAPIFVLHWSPEDHIPPDVRSESLKRLANDLQTRSPGAIMLVLPPGWCFRVVRIDDDVTCI